MQKVVYKYTAGAWVSDKDIWFVYDGWNLVKETTASEGQAASYKHYFWGLDLSQTLQSAGGVGGLLTAVEGTLTYLYTYDANGNVGEMIDADDGSIGAHYEYDPFGNVLLAPGSMAKKNVFRFSTKYTECETNLHYYGYRYYYSELGRWINRDPIQEEGGFNLYRFVSNDGINGNDYLGKYNWPCFFACWLGFDEDIFRAMREKNPDLLSRKNRRWLEKMFLKENKNKMKGMSESAAKAYRKTWLPKTLRSEGIKKVQRMAWKKFGRIVGTKAAIWVTGTAIGAGAGAPVGGVGAAPGAAVGFVVSTGINIVSGYKDLKEICQCAWKCK